MQAAGSGKKEYYGSKEAGICTNPELPASQYADWVEGHKGTLWQRISKGKKTCYSNEICQ